MKKQFLFGPVPSRRLGLSLGVDLVRPKCCSLDCVYCESGETTELTTRRCEAAPAAAVIAELDEFLKERPALDFITFSGAGEPTLNSGIGEVAAFLKRNYPEYRICLLTNATLFLDPAVRRELREIDLAVPSLDASNEAEFQRINRPAPGLTLPGLLEGLRLFCREFPGEVVLEIFIVPGVNDSDASIARFAAIVKELKVAKVQLNTLDRPACVDWVKPSTAENTRRFIAALEPLVPVEAVGPFRYRSAALRQPVPDSELDRRILALAARRPVTAADLESSLGIAPETVRRQLDELLRRGALESERQARGEFFRTSQSAE